MKKHDVKSFNKDGIKFHTKYNVKINKIKNYTTNCDTNKVTTRS